ncbi:hypothetical protein MGAST_03790 [Mycobacterium gastri 'Wayne']|nr:hypothetical protein MGAST_03790 [Mycobacterium gastri 'Wayne']
MSGGVLNWRTNIRYATMTIQESGSAIISSETHDAKRDAHLRLLRWREDDELNSRRCGTTRGENWDEYLGN